MVTMVRLHNCMIKHVLVYISFLCTRTQTLVSFVSCLHFACYASLCPAAIASSLQSACSAFVCSTWFRSILPLCNLGPVVEGGQYCQRELLHFDAQFRVISSDWRPFSPREGKEYSIITFWESSLSLNLISHLKVASSFFPMTSHYRTYFPH